MYRSSGSTGQDVRSDRETRWEAARDRWEQLRRRGHDLVIQECERWGGVPKDAAAFFWDLRANRKSIFTSARRFIDAAIVRGTPCDVLVEIPRALLAYITAACDERDQRQRGVCGAYGGLLGSTL